MKHLIAGCIFLTVPAFLSAQTFVLAEEGMTSSGQAVSSLAVLTFDGTSTVTGSEIRQSAGTVSQVSVFGTYSVDSTGGGIITLMNESTGDDGTTNLSTSAYTFLQFRATGFAAIRTDNGAAGIARLTPAGTSVKGNFALLEQGVSSSGQARANLGAVVMAADGTLSGAMLGTASGATTRSAVTGSYTTGANGIGQMTLFVPGPTDEDGGTSLLSLRYAFAITATNEVLALRLDNSLLGFTEMAPVL